MSGAEVEMSMSDQVRAASIKRARPPGAMIYERVKRRSRSRDSR
jgi:hypothetical protein